MSHYSTFCTLTPDLVVLVSRRAVDTYSDRRFSISATRIHARPWSRMYSQKLRCPSELNQLPEPAPTLRAPRWLRMCSKIAAKLRNSSDESSIGSAVYFSRRVFTENLKGEHKNRTGIRKSQHSLGQKVRGGGGFGLAFDLTRSPFCAAEGPLCSTHRHGLTASAPMGNTSITEGKTAVAVGSTSIARGKTTVSLGNSSIFRGVTTTSMGDSTIQRQKTTVALGRASFSRGTTTTSFRKALTGKRRNT
ncbi:unnamed protein product [Menidia menidia]|nr:unnamed protein product [Menidia menidia]